MMLGEPAPLCTRRRKRGLNMSPAPSDKAAAKSRTAYLLETVSHIGFLAFATVCAVLLFLQGQDWIMLSPPFKVLFLVAWTPFFWTQYWTARLAASRRTWLVFICAAIYSATVILATIVTLLGLAR